jgi:hypothetical protein
LPQKTQKGTNTIASDDLNRQERQEREEEKQMSSLGVLCVLGG